MISLYTALTDRLAKADWLLTTLARLIFAGTLLMYFWASALTKVGDGIFGLFVPSVGAYAQIFPRLMEEIVYDTSQLGFYHWAVVTGGMWAEFILPVLVVLGFMTRLSSLGMIGFVVVQSLTDLIGHGGLEHKETFGAWFDRVPDSVILDQRAFWVFLLLVLVLKGGGPLSLDAALGKRYAAQPA